MRPDVSQSPKPEERELAKKSAALAGLQAELAQRELDLATLRAELRDFERRYLRIVGARYAELDEIEAQITEALAQLAPQDIGIQEQAVHARTQASESAQASKIAAKQAPLKDFTPSENLKKLYREVAKRVHPDFSTDETDHVRRQRFMAEANRAYEEGDEARLTAILVEWDSSPEAVKGDGIGAELVRTIRKIAQIRERLMRIEAEIEELKRSELHQLKMEMNKGVVEGRDLLEEMKSRLDEQIVAARSRFRDMSLTRPAP